MSLADAGRRNGTRATNAERATLGGGCFWCLEAVYKELRGVRSGMSGYAGGHVEHPTYQQVCGKQTGHAEVVQLEYDPSQITFGDLLDVFFTIHDPTTKDRQGNDVGPQYRSIILTHSPEQEQVARDAIARARSHWPAPIVTEVRPLVRFWPAETSHDDYFARNPQNPYCAVVVAPKVAKARKAFLDRLISR